MNLTRKISFIRVTFFKGASQKNFSKLFWLLRRLILKVIRSSAHLKYDLYWLETSIFHIASIWWKCCLMLRSEFFKSFWVNIFVHLQFLPWNETIEVSFSHFWRLRAFEVKLLSIVPLSYQLSPESIRPVMLFQSHSLLCNS